MKKQMRFAAMLAGAVMLGGTIPAAPVTALHCWGITDQNELQDMTLLDDKGMLSWVPYGEGMGTDNDYQVLTYHYSYDKEIEWFDLDTGENKTEMHHFEGNPVYVVCPRENVLRIVLRKELDHAEAEQKMYEILEHYYPGVRSNECPNCSVYQVTVGVPDLECYYDLVDNSKRFPTEEAKTAGVPEIADGILHDLAKAGLISEFYTWGQTANYQQVTLHSRNASPTVYFPEGWYWDEAEHKTVTINYDWEAIEAYVKEHHPECEFVRVTLEDTELAKEIGYYDYEQNRVYFGNYDEMYAVIPPDGTTFSEHFAIAADLYDEFGIACEWACPESTGSSLTGQNALAAAGDVNLDCSIDVSDAVLIARFAAEDREAVITDQGRKNADVTHDGNVDSQDAAKILQYIAKKISLEDLAK